MAGDPVRPLITSPATFVGGAGHIHDTSGMLVMLAAAMGAAPKAKPGDGGVVRRPDPIPVPPVVMNLNQAFRQQQQQIPAQINFGIPNQATGQGSSPLPNGVQGSMLPMRQGPPMMGTIPLLGDENGKDGVIILGFPSADDLGIHPPRDPEDPPRELTEEELQALLIKELDDECKQHPNSEYCQALMDEICKRWPSHPRCRKTPKDPPRWWPPGWPWPPKQLESADPLFPGPWFPSEPLGWEWPPETPGWWPPFWPWPPKNEAPPEPPPPPPKKPPPDHNPLAETHEAILKLVKKKMEGGTSWGDPMVDWGVGNVILGLLGLGPLFPGGPTVKIRSGSGGDGKVGGKGISIEVDPK